MAVGALKCEIMENPNFTLRLLSEKPTVSLAIDEPILKSRLGYWEEDKYFWSLKEKADV